MPTSFYEVEVTVPAGTAIATPQITDVSLPPGLISSIEWRVPPGPRGAVGFQLGSSGWPVLPRTPGTWIVADDDKQTWQSSEFIDSGSWQVFAYNTGNYDHTLYFTFAWDPPGGAPSTSSAGTQPIPASDLSSSATYGATGTPITAPSPNGPVPAGVPQSPSTDGVGQPPPLEPLPVQAPPPTEPLPPQEAPPPLPAPPSI